jgi:hypothetical protein
MGTTSALMQLMLAAFGTIGTTTQPATRDGAGAGNLLARSPLFGGEVKSSGAETAVDRAMAAGTMVNQGPENLPSIGLLRLGQQQRKSPLEALWNAPRESGDSAGRDDGGRSISLSAFLQRYTPNNEFLAQQTGSGTQGNATPGSATPGSATPGSATPGGVASGNATSGGVASGNATSGGFSASAQIEQVAFDTSSAQAMSAPKKKPIPVTTVTPPKEKPAPDSGSGAQTGGSETGGSETGTGTGTGMGTGMGTGTGTGTGTGSGTGSGTGTSTGTSTGPLPDTTRPDSTAVETPETGALEVVAGRVTTISHAAEPGEKIAAIRILEGPEAGNVTVNPDKTLALVLDNDAPAGADSFRYEVTYSNGTKATFEAELKVTPGPQTAGWGHGQHYKLDTDAEDRTVIETGDNHREVYVSASKDALSLADIAALEGVKVGTITGKWLAEHPEYGNSPAMALDQQAGLALWKAITGGKAEPSSHWLLLERGYDYGEMNAMVNAGTQGESALHPVVITAWGKGDPPNITTSQVYNNPDNAHIVVKGLMFSDGIKFMQGENILLEDVYITGETLVTKDVDNFTLRHSSIVDVYREESNSKGVWEAHINRISGMYSNRTDSLLIENNLVDHSGWADDYRTDLSLKGGQVPSIYSHNLYLSYDNTDVTLRDNILMRSASFGAQVRSGGFIEGNLFLDNNAAVNFLGGDDEKTHGTGNYTLFMDNVVTSGAHKKIDKYPGGALTLGVDNSGRMTTLVGNIVAHLADPNNPSELSQKYVGHDPLKMKFDAFYNDTIIYNWIGQRDIERKTATDEANTEGLSQAVMDKTTIQVFAGQLLGKKTATIAEFADYLRAQADGRLDNVVDADLVNAFFQKGFGLATDIRAEETTLRFIPHELGDGVRWDNRLNWSTGDLPGTQDGDSVDLGGNWVQYSSATQALTHLDLGSGGRLTVTGGKLTVEKELAAGDAGGKLVIDNAGQVWTRGYSDDDRLTVDMDGGRFVNTGLVKGKVEMTVGEDAQAILATHKAAFDLITGSKLAIEGGEVRAGFDGDAGMALLRMGNGATLAFTAAGGAFGTISEFRSGAFDDTPDVTSGIRLDGQLHLDLAGIGAGTSTWTLLSADEIIGSFDKITADGLGAKRDLRVTVDYDKDTVTLILGAEGAGSGKINSSVVGDEDGFLGGGKPATALWSALDESPGALADNPISSTADDMTPGWML